MMALDKITQELFYQLRGNINEESELIICPRCSNSLEPLLLDVFKEGHVEYQRIWWTCRGLNNKSCCFPLDMPVEIYWTKRTMDQMKEGIIPLPNIHLLPNQYHHLYPSVFKIKEAAEAMRNNNRTTLRVRRKRIISEDESELLKNLTPPNSRPESIEPYPESPIDTDTVDPGKPIDVEIVFRNSTLSEGEMDYDADDEVQESFDNVMSRYHERLRKNRKRILNRYTSESPPRIMPYNGNREKWAEQVKQSIGSLKHNPNQKSSELTFDIGPCFETEEDGNELDLKHVEFNKEARQKVDLFATRSAALSSLLSLQYTGDRFLNKVSQERHRKFQTKPQATLPQKQRIRMQTLLNKSMLPDPMLESIVSQLEESDNSLRRDMTSDKNLEPKQGSSSINLLTAAPNTDVRDAVDGLLALTDVNQQVCANPAVKSHLQSETNGLPEIKSKSALQCIGAYSKALDLQKRLGYSGVTKCYQSLPASAVTHSELNRTDSSKGTESSTVPDCVRKENKHQTPSEPVEVNPEIQSMINRKLKKIIREKKSIFSKKVSRPKLVEDEEKPEMSQEVNNETNVRFVDQYGFEINMETEGLVNFDLASNYYPAHGEELCLDDIL